MKIVAYLLAFGTEVPVPTREIDVPDDEIMGGVDSFLDAAYKYGQNDFQPRPIRSVSVGDVIQLPGGGLHRVLGSGFEALPEGTDINTLERGNAALLR
jgi:hypothetical protein